MTIIKPKGSYLTTDSDGCILPSPLLGNIQPEWKPVIDAFVKKIAHYHGNNLHSIYIRGSVAKGEAVPHVSDLDAFIVLYVETNNKEAYKMWLVQCKKELQERFPFVEKFETPTYTAERAGSGWVAQFIKTQSICVYGENLQQTLPSVHISQSSIHLKNIVSEIEEFIDEGKRGVILIDETKSKCTWIMKRILRTAHELVAIQSKKYTRDLYYCWKGFCEYYPEHKELMYVVLGLSLNPTDDVEEIVEILEWTMEWLPDTVEQYNKS